MNPLSVVVRTGCDLFAWFMVVFGVNVLVHGYMTPGGGFQGGAIIATFTAFLLVAYGGRKLLGWANEKIFDLFEEVGLLAFFFLAFMGFPVTFFYNYLVKPPCSRRRRSAGRHDGAHVHRGGTRSERRSFDGYSHDVQGDPHVRDRPDGGGDRS